MKITFLGTGTSQGVPVIGCHCEVCSSVDYRDNRLRTSILIELNGKQFVVDTGPDFRQQMLRERVDHLDAILFTHAHKDHTAGLDDIRSYNFRQKKNMPIYGRQEVLDQLQQEFSYIFKEPNNPAIPKVELHALDGSPFQVQGQDIIPIEVMHHKLPVHGFRIGDFTYITDANHISEAEKEKVKGSKVIVINALQKEAHISHFTFDEAISLMEELAPEKAYFTHISHRLGLHKEVSKEVPDFIDLAWDGLTISL